MYQLNRLMVALDFTAMDEMLIKYTAFIANLIKVEQVYFIHVQKFLDIPEDLKSELYGDSSQPIDELLQAKMKQEVEKNFKNHQDFNTEFITVEGTQLTQLLHWSHIKKIDLFVTGHKKKSQGSGILPQRLARRAACSILFVPEDVRLQCEKIFVGLDFSNNSRFALDKAIGIAKLTGATIHCHHIYSVPTGFHTSGKSFQEYAAIMKNHAKKRYDKYISETKIPKGIEIVPMFSVDKGGKAPLVFTQKARAIKTDLILVSSKGRSSIAAFILGSFTERVIGSDHKTVILVVKDKKKNMGALEALLKI
jgi:nucleotide-binding universal stress UspA family protein